MPNRVWINTATQIRVTVMHQVLLSYYSLAKQLHSQILDVPLENI